MKELIYGDTVFRLGMTAAFQSSWHSQNKAYENMPGIIIELRDSVVRIQYSDGKQCGPSPYNAYIFPEYKTNKEASHLLNKEEFT